MTIRSEIRAALAAGNPLNAASLLAKVPSLAGDMRKMQWNLTALKAEARIRVAGTSEEGPCYAIDDWPVSESGRAVPHPRGTSPRALRKAGKTKGADTSKKPGKAAKAAKKRGPKAGATAAPKPAPKPARKPRAAPARGERVERAEKALVPAPIQSADAPDEYRVGLLADGGLQVHNVTQGQIEELPPAFTQQVARLLSIAAGREVA